MILALPRLASVFSSVLLLGAAANAASYSRSTFEAATPAERALLDTDAALAQLSPAVRADLAKRSPDEYTLFLNRDDTSRLRKRIGPGITNCAPGKVAITLDDGPFTFHSNISDRFSAAGQVANFFVNGNNFGCIYDPANVASLRHSYARGHRILTHTWSHPFLASGGLTTQQIDKQIQFVEDALWKILGVVPAFVRPPYGDTNATVNNYLERRWGLKVIQWNADTGDATGNTTAQQKALFDTFQRGQAQLVLAHETNRGTAEEVIPYALRRLNAIGQPSLALDKCLQGQPAPYKVVGRRSERDATWTCAGKPAPGAV